jgi:hypothetical protein
MRVTKTQTLRVGKKLNVNFDHVHVDTLRHGINVELEHGSRHGPNLNVTNNSITKSAIIALAHIYEFPDYYEALEKMEEKLKQKWRGKRKPSIFL